MIVISPYERKKVISLHAFKQGKGKIKENQREKIPHPPNQCQDKLSLKTSVFASI